MTNTLTAAAIVARGFLTAVRSGLAAMGGVIPRDGRRAILIGVASELGESIARH